MKIERPRNADRPSSTRRTKRGGSVEREAFVRELEKGGEGPIEGPPPVGSGPGPVDKLESLLSLQEVNPAKAGQARARQRGAKLLNHLDEIRHALLIGGISRRALEELERSVKAERQAVDDPNLRSVLDEIELRAAVELAKWSNRD